jgi:hypothetical protein
MVELARRASSQALSFSERCLQQVFFEREQMHSMQVVQFHWALLMPWQVLHS